MTWQITQTGASFSGVLTSTDAATNIVGRGSISGSISGSSIQFSIAVPAGGFDAPFATCSADITGDAQASDSSITGKYSGTNSCMGAITAGNLSLNRSG